MKWSIARQETGIGLNRELSIDLAKSVAICAVLMIHCSANHFARYAVGSSLWLATDFLGSVSRWAVSLFLLCSGAVMNDPDRNISLKKLFSKYLLRLFVILTMWSIFYECLLMFNARHTAPLNELLSGSIKNLLYGNVHYHLYFFWFIFALYLALPLTRLVTCFAKEQEIRYVIFIYIISGGILPLLSCYWPVNQMQASLLYLAIPAAAFCPGLGLLGWYLHKHPPKHWFGPLGLFLTGFIVTFLGTWIRSSRAGTLDGVYLNGLSPFVITMAVGVFQFCQYVSTRIQGNMIQQFSCASFCVYLIHPAFQEALAPSWFLTLPVYVAVPLQWSMLVALSVLAYFVLKRIPVIRAWLI